MTAALYNKAADERLLELRDIVKDIHRPKSTRETALRELRVLEREQGVEVVGDMNGG